MYSISFSDSKTLFSMMKKYLLAEMLLGDKIFIDCDDSHVRELFAHKLATELFEQTRKKTLWLRLEDAPTSFEIHGGSKNHIDLLHLVGESETWSKSLTSLLEQVKEYEPDYGMVILDSACEAQAPSGIQERGKSAFRLKKITNAILRLNKVFCERDVNLVLIGEVDPALKTPCHYGALTNTEFNSIRHLFQFIFSLRELKQPEHMRKFDGSSYDQRNQSWLGNLSIRELEKDGTARSGLETGFEIVLSA